MASLRRSSRHGPPTKDDSDVDSKEASSSDEEKKEEVQRSINKSVRLSTRKKTKIVPKLAPDSDSENEEEEDESSSSSDEDSDAAPKSTKKQRPAPIKTKAAPSKKDKAKPRPSPRGSSLAALAKKCLFEKETVDNSLLAALLSSKNLSALAAQVMNDYQTDSSFTRIQLINLLFRSVGSTLDACIDAEDTQVDDLDEDEWQHILTLVFEKMQEVPLAKVLMHLDPSKNKAFREAYQEFYYQLIMAALNDKDGIAAVQIESVNAILGAIIMLVNVGQPDMRLAASIAVYRMSKAILETTKELNSKVETGQRHLQVAKRNKSRVKANTLEKEIAAWSEASEKLSNIVIEIVMSGVFTKRCRDSEPFIRICSLDALSEFCLIRPDIFVAGRFLKYFAWFLHDKEPTVRYAAMHGLSVPLQAMQDKKIIFDISNLEKLVQKFHDQIAKLVLDVSVTNQEKATELLLLLLRGGYLDDISEPEIWNRINSRALASDTSPVVRKNALYFIMAQCQPFDDHDYMDVYTEKRSIDQIGALATWAAATLSKGDIPTDHVRYELVDHMVQSLMAMDEYRSLVTSWTAMLKALQSEDLSDDSRADTIKLRTILRMLVAAAEVEAFTGSFKTFYKSADVDPDLIELEENKIKGLALPKTKHGKKSSLSAREDFNEAITSVLPQLLADFKGNTHVIRQLTRLPRYFRIDVFNMPSQKKKFAALVQSLSALFLELTDPEILANCAFSLAAFARASHSRAGEALLELTRIACLLRDRMYELISKKRGLVDGSGDPSELCEVESAKSICLLRLATLSKRWDVADLLGDGSDEGGDVAIRRLWQHVSKDLEFELIARIVKWEENDDGSASMRQPPHPVIPSTWDFEDDSLHGFVSDSVKNCLEFFYSSMAWRFGKEVGKIDDEEQPVEEMDDEQLKDHVLLYMRDQIIKLLCLSFEQQLDVEEYDEGTFSESHISFTTNVMMHAHAAAGDLALLFPDWMRDAKNPLLRMLSDFQEKPSMIYGAMQRFVSTMDEQLRTCLISGEEDKGLARSLLLPLARSSMVNMLHQKTQRQGAFVVEHRTGYGEVAGEIACELNKVAKKLNPLLCAHNQFIALQTAFNAWCAAEPEEPGDMPTEEENDEHQAAVDKHHAMMQDLVTKAQQLNSVFGVGSLQAKDKTSLTAVFHLVREGLLSSFFTEDDQPVGARLPLLRPLAKYLVRIKGNSELMDDIRSILNEKELELREAADYQDLSAYDIESIDEFRKAGGFGSFSAKRHSRKTNESVDSVAATSPGTKVSGGSVSSGSLSPVPEGLDEDEDPDTPMTRKSTNTRPSVMSSTNASTRDDDASSHDSVASAATKSEDEGSDDDDSQSSDPTRKRSSTAASATSTKRLKSDASDTTSRAASASRTLLGTRVSTVASPLSSTSGSMATVSVFDKDTFAGKKRRHGSFGGKGKSGGDASSSPFRSSRPSRTNKLTTLSESTIQHHDSSSEED